MELKGHRDSLFQWFFGSKEHKEWTLSLYNALNGTHYTDPTEIQYMRTGTMLYIWVQSGVSFLVDARMTLYGRQSTCYPNLPYFFLIHMGKAFFSYYLHMKMNLTSSRQQTFPRPRCICFCNGPETEPDLRILKLSDGFEDVVRAGEAEKAEGKKQPASEEQHQEPESMEFPNVVLYNVSPGHNIELMEACKALSEYAWIIATIRANRTEKQLEPEEAIDKTLLSMPDDFIARDEILAHMAEVKNMVLVEYNEEVQREAMLRDARLEGIMELWKTQVRGVRFWVEDGCNEHTRALVAKSVGLTLEQFDEIQRIILEHPEYDDKDVVKVLGWNSVNGMDDLDDWITGTDQ